MSPRSYFIIRLFTLGIQLLGVSAVLFGVYAFTEYDPAEGHAFFGGSEAVAAERIRLGTNYSYFEQFTNFWSDLILGDCDLPFGGSGCNRTMGIGWEGQTHLQPIDTIVSNRFTNSIIVLISAFVIYGLVGIGLGTLSAEKKGRFDQASQVVNIGVSGIPVVLLAIYSYLLFSNYGNILFPFDSSFNVINIRFVDLSQGLQGNWQYVLVLVFTLALISIPRIYRLTKIRIQEELSRNYIKTARAKGLSTQRIIFGHALPNARSGIINDLAASLQMGFTSLAIIEFVFFYQGLFGLMLQSVVNYNFPIIHAGALYIGGFTLLMLTIGDIIVAWTSKIPEQEF